MKVNLRVSALNDVALNVNIAAFLSASNWRKEFADFAVPVPLSHDGTPEVARIALRLNGADIEAMVAAYAKDRQLNLNLRANCSSLEGLKWKTCVKYVLKFRPADAEKIQSLVGEDQKIIELWANQAVVQADYSVSPGSWEHSSAK
ncbi:hypothetical protein NKY68_00125 [Sinorhizobium meliloti]|uniref:hypothetical protein n=1 Tax=Rhizobium meliloti TaxID=382 RepID=UPI003D65D028